MRESTAHTNTTHGMMHLPETVEAGRKADGGLRGLAAGTEGRLAAQGDTETFYDGRNVGVVVVT